MELNLKYYNEKDNYSDGDIENDLLNFIDKFGDNSEKILAKNSCWPIFYHLSDVRKNSVRWYPFKKDSTILEVGGGMGAITGELVKKCKHVTSIELSKRRAEAILKRNKDAKNLEIMVGNFKNIKLNKKYDYILLNGVLEYGALYMDSENPYIDFINKLKNNLKEDGVILIAIENKFGIKYWCGSNEDHTNIQFDGLNNYPSNSKIRTFSKYKLEEIANKCELFCKFYYMFPDYKFPKVIYSDYYDKDLFTHYTPYYSNKSDILLNEKNLYKEIYDNKTIPFFANSFFVEMSPKKIETNIKFVKFNNEYRKKEYDLLTVFDNDKFFKYPSNEKSIEHLRNYKKINDILQKNNIKTPKYIFDKDYLYSEIVEGKNLKDILIQSYFDKNYDFIYKTFDKIKNILLTFEKTKNIDNTIFEKYKIKNVKKDKFIYIKDGIVDLIPSNIIVKNDQYYVIDQEWYEKNCPIDYIMFRAIENTYCNSNVDDDFITKLYKKYKIDNKLFRELEERFYCSVRNSEYYIYLDYSNNYDLININELRNQISSLNNTVKDLEQSNRNLSLENSRVNEELNNIINSKGYRYVEKLRKAKNVFKHKKNK